MNILETKLIIFIIKDCKIQMLLKRIRKIKIMKMIITFIKVKLLIIKRDFNEMKNASINLKQIHMNLINKIIKIKEKINKYCHFLIMTKNKMIYRALKAAKKNPKIKIENSKIMMTNNNFLIKIGN